MDAGGFGIFSDNGDHSMIFITGPLYSGKRDYAKTLLGCDDDSLGEYAIWDVQQFAAQTRDVSALAERLSHYPVVIATEIGGGVVPIDPQERQARENAGRLACMLAQRAERVVRVFCGIPIELKEKRNTRETDK